MKFCEKCGSKLNDAAQFCSFCGLKLYGSETPLSLAKQPDPALTKNIVLVTIYALLTLISILPARAAGSMGIGVCTVYLCITALLAFFAIRPSDDHVDTAKMNLLKTIESFGVSALYLITSFFIAGIIALIYQPFALGFALMTVRKITRINLTHRTATERVFLAFSIVLIILSSFYSFGLFLSIII